MADRARQKKPAQESQMITPFFKNMGHYEFEDNIVLPFIPAAHKSNAGGYSEVFPVRLHNSHHSFWPPAENPEREPLIAIKRLRSGDREEFDEEVAMLKLVAFKQHSHMIQLLATYQYKGSYHLMFPFAQCDLRKYWDDRPNPDFNYATIFWSLKQISGIANALVCLHGSKATSARPGEDTFGRHGDIKPENVLWFDRMTSVDDPAGILQLADFGLARFDERESHSSNMPDTSPTYAPPECMLKKNISCAFDIWGLGCVILEYVTWMLRGTDAIYQFADVRMENNLGNDSDHHVTVVDDNYFTVVGNKKTVKGAVVRQQVIDWVADLHAHRKASLLIHDLLELTMRRLLVADAQGRAKAGVVYNDLRGFLEKARTDKSYVIRAVPWPKPKR